MSDAVLALSSRMGVEGMASSTQMKMLNVQDFKVIDGNFIKTSDFTGKVTICTTGPALIFTGHTGDSIPKKAVMFEQCLVAEMGVVPSTWSNLDMWKHLCVFVTTVDVSREKHFVGIAAANEGEFVSFAAVVEGGDEHAGDNGGRWGTFEVVIVTIGSVLVVAASSLGYLWGSRTKSETGISSSDTSTRPADETIHFELSRVRAAPA